LNISTVGLLSPGDMGHAIGAVLQQHGLRIVTCLSGRSPRTYALAEAAGIQNISDEETFVQETDLLLSILPPSQAPGCARRIAGLLRKTGTTLLFVDCNAIAPRTVLALEQVITEAGGSFVDAGIIGGPPSQGRAGPRIYVSGPDAPEVAKLSTSGLDIRVLGSVIGQASGLKMCYASLTKGLTALATEALVASEALGLQDTLLAEFRSLPLFETIKRSVPGMPPKAYRWVAEMEEIALTFADLGLPPQLHQGAAALYHFVEGTVLGEETPEQRRYGQTLEEVSRILAQALTTRLPDSADLTGSSGESEEG
jgi:3-hydroxyisobutyrate dehydrogenase-like beta-hydroxyacid dehydrogenase